MGIPSVSGPIEAVRTNSPQIANDEFEVKDQRIYIRADSDLPIETSCAR